MIAGPLTAQDTIDLQVTYYDFRQDHPNMQIPGNGVETGRVMDTLGADGLPVWNPAATLRAYTNEADFNTWYRPTAGQNIVVRDQTLSLTRDEQGMFVYANTNFYPLDNRGWTAVDGAQREAPQMAADGQLHNFYFTMHGQARFSFSDGQTFTFTGDDDLWVFFGGKLGVDIGGIHGENSASIDSAGLRALGLQPGVEYDLDIFFAERHTDDSNFRITTSLDMRPPSPEQIAGSEIDCICAAEPALFAGMAELPIYVPSNTTGAYDPARHPSYAFITQLLSDQRHLMLTYTLRLYPAELDGRVRGRLCYAGYFRDCFDDFYLPSATGTDMAIAVTGGGPQSKLVITITEQSRESFGVLDFALYDDAGNRAVFGLLQHMSE